MPGVYRQHPVEGNAARLATVAMLLVAVAAHGADCTQTSVGTVPLDELGTGLYLGQLAGGLYPGGANVAPPAHLAAGRARARAIVPLNAAGEPDPTGRYVLLSIGMSNTTQEFCSASETYVACNSWTFMGQAAADATVDDEALVIVNGARGGQVASTWDAPTDSNYDFVRDSRLTPAGVAEQQVVAAWVKVANPTPSVGLPAANADAYTLLVRMGNIARALKSRYPNLQLAFFSSRVYAGYASTTLNPEPYAYESGFAVMPPWAPSTMTRRGLRS